MNSELDNWIEQPSKKTISVFDKDQESMKHSTISDRVRGRRKSSSSIYIRVRVQLGYAMTHFMFVMTPLRTFRIPTTHSSWVRTSADVWYVTAVIKMDEREGEQPVNSRDEKQSSVMFWVCIYLCVFRYVILKNDTRWPVITYCRSKYDRIKSVFDLQTCSRLSSLLLT